MLVKSAGHRAGSRLGPSLWAQRELIWQMTLREVSLRYRGAYLGMVWSFVNPLIMLMIYTFVYSMIFHARWEGQPPGRAGETFFALALFAGLIPFMVFAELANRAPTLILNVPNYVKKVVFPLEILPVVALGSALINSLFSIAILLLGSVLLQRMISPFLLLLPLAYLPLVLVSLGVGWFLASLGTYLRDLAQATNPTVQMLSFLAPIFYPLSAIQWRPVRSLLMINPLTPIVLGFRQALLGQGHEIGSKSWLACTACSAVFAFLGYVFFQHTKKGFADVL